MSDLDLDEAALQELIDDVARDAMHEAAVKVEARAKALAPRLTGRLAASITATESDGPSGPAAEVSTDVDYWIYVEFGGGRGRAQPFLRPALDA